MFAKLTIKTFALSVLLVTAFVLSGAASAEGKYITQKQLKKGPITLVVKGHGKIMITEIQARKAKGRHCQVEVSMLRKLLADQLGSGRLEFEVNRTATISLGLSECTSREGETVICCKGSGKDCVISAAR